MKWFHVTKSKVTDQTYVFYLSEYMRDLTAGNMHTHVFSQSK